MSKPAPQRSVINTPPIDDVPSTVDVGVIVYVVVPPDGGWGWVVMVACFGLNAICDGNMYAFAAYVNTLSKEFGAQGTATISALLFGLEMLIGPIVSAMCNRFGFRVVAILGAIIAGSGFCISYYANSIGLLCFTYGALGGIGFSMIYMPSVIAVGFYFNRWRGLATCFAICGSGFGATLFNFLVGIAITNYGWRFAMVIQGGIIFSGILFAALLRPLQPTAVTPTPTTNVYSASTRRFQPNTVFPTGVQMSTHSSTQEGELRIWYNPDPTSVYSSTSVMMPASSEHAVRPQKKAPCCLDMTRWCKRTFDCLETIGSRPFYRDDIMFDGSLNRAAKYSDLRSPSNYHLSVTRAATVKDIEESRKCCILCPRSFTRTLATMLDLSLLKSPTFILLVCSGIFYNFASFILYVYVKDRALSAGFSEDETSMLTAMMNGFNIVGRILGGVVVSFFPRINVLIVNMSTVSASGVVVLGSCLSNALEVQMAYCVAIGLLTALNSALRPIMLVKLLGLQKLTNAFGLLMMFFGFSAIVGLLTSGLIKEATGTYNEVILISGALILMSGIILYPIIYVNKREKAKRRT